MHESVKYCIQNDTSSEYCEMCQQKYDRIYRVDIKISPSLPLLFLDISSMRKHLKTKFYTTVKQEKTHFTTKTRLNIYLKMTKLCCFKTKVTPTSQRSESVGGCEKSRFVDDEMRLQT